MQLMYMVPSISFDHKIRCVSNFLLRAYVYTLHYRHYPCMHVKYEQEKGDCACASVHLKLELATLHSDVHDMTYGVELSLPVGLSARTARRVHTARCRSIDIRRCSVCVGRRGAVRACATNLRAIIASFFMCQCRLVLQYVVRLQCTPRHKRKRLAGHDGELRARRCHGS